MSKDFKARQVDQTGVMLKDAFNPARPKAKRQGVEVAHIGNHHPRLLTHTPVERGAQHGSRGGVHHQQRGIDALRRVRPPPASGS